MCGHPIKKEKKKKSIYRERERERVGFKLHVV